MLIHNNGNRKGGLQFGPPAAAKNPPAPQQAATGKASKRRAAPPQPLRGLWFAPKPTTEEPKPSEASE
jgi:hypothetical protein